METIFGFVGDVAVQSSRNRIMNNNMMKTLEKAKAFSAENGVSLHEALLVMQISLIENINYLVDNVDSNIDKQTR